MLPRPCRMTQIVTFCLLAAFVVFIIGCGPKKLGRSTLTTKIADREVKASLDGAGFISSEGDAAVVKFNGGTLIVKKGSVELNGKELVKFSEDAKKVEVDYTAGKLTITADGESVLSTELQK